MRRNEPYEALVYRHVCVAGHGDRVLPVVRVLPIRVDRRDVVCRVVTVQPRVDVVDDTLVDDGLKFAREEGRSWRLLCVRRE